MKNKRPDPEQVERLGAALKAVYGRAVNEPVPGKFDALLKGLK